jgi:hypothetical protein
MTIPPLWTLHTALRAHAAGIYPLEAGTELLINGPLLRRDDFLDRFIHLGTSIMDGVTLIAAINWPEAITALRSGDLPCSGGEQRMLRIAASLADALPVDLGDTLTGLDNHNIKLVTTAVLHASGRRP